MNAMTNREVAEKLLEHARSLSGSEHIFRVRAYRQAALSVDRLTRPLTELLRRGGRRALAEVPGIGAHLSFSIATLIETGKFVPWSERKPPRAA